MAISFEESLKATVSTTANTADYSIATDDIAVASMPMVDMAGIATTEATDMIAAYSGDSGSWNELSKYPVFRNFTDDNYSIVSDTKEIKLNLKQFNITQEENSQYIPFEMPRKYDGIDLINMALSVHYTKKSGEHGSDEPINVTYNTEKIRLGWLVSGNATNEPGPIEFEIHARGTIADSKGVARGYTWKTQGCKDLVVIQSNCSCDGEVDELDDTWVETLVTNVAEAVADEIKNVAVGDQVAAAESAAKEAEAHANRAETAVTNAENAATTAVTNALVDYSTTTEMEAYVAQQVANADIENKLTEYAKTEDVNELVGDIGDSENVVSYVDTAVASVDVTEQLKDYAKVSDVEALSNRFGNLVDDDNQPMTVEAYVDRKVEEVDVSEELGDLGKNEDGTKKTVVQYVDEAVAAVDVSEQLNDYATTTYVSTAISPLSTSIDKNAKDISSLSKTVTELQDDLNNVDTDSPRYTYDVAYNDTEDPNVGENVFVFYEIENEGEDNEVREAKKKFTIVGGGGSSTSSTLKIEYITKTPLVATKDSEVNIYYNYSGTDSSGDAVQEGLATWKIAGTIVATETIAAGENHFDVTKYLKVGTQKVALSVSDDAGSLVTKSWTVQVVDVRIESAFNDKITYEIGEVSLGYTPYGAVPKTIHFVLDKTELPSVTTSASGIPTDYVLPAQEHGSHLLDMYMTATVGADTISSNHVYKDIMWFDSTRTEPVISCIQQNFTARQYDTTNILYSVYDPATETPTVSLAVDDIVISTLTLDTHTQTWQFKSSDVGTHKLTITCGTTVKTLTATITELGINVTPVTAGLAFDFNPVGFSNSDANRLWSDKDVTMSVSDNFDWVNGGYQYDDNGDQYFCVKAGTTATINYNLFADDAKASGKEFKVVFSTANIRKRDTSFLSCMNSGIGLDMKVESANLYSSNSNLYSPYCENDIIEFEFNISKMDEIPLVMTYEDGVGNRPLIYTSDASFWQASPQPITIGCDDCDVHIYRMKAYKNSLSDSNILANFIADARNADEMLRRHDRNQIYDENSTLVPEVLAEKCPDLRIIMLDAPYFTNDKDNKVDDTNIRMIYKNGDPALDNWTCTGARHSGQGTSSNEYGYSARNIDLIMDRDTSLFTLGDNTTSKTITLTRTSVPTEYLNLKVNVASSENQNNAQMARRYNQYNPFVRSAKFNDSKVKDCMEFYNCVLFIRERNEDITTHREFKDTNYHFYAIGNIGDSKKTDDTRVNDKNDPKECILEITDYNVPLAEFPTGSNGICAEEDWVSGNSAYDLLYSDYKYKEGKFKAFGSESYEFRYEMSGLTDEQREENINAWRDFYKFVVTSPDEQFHNKLKEYFVVDSALYYYLFTERYTMVDNRAKNSFWHYGKVYITTSEAESLGSAAGGFVIDDEQAAIRNGYRWDLSFGYDFDTSLGIDNTGKLVLTYGKEDVDYYVDDDPSSGYIYRAAESTFFCRLRDLFASELRGMFVEIEEAWSANSLINQWDEAQSQFPEELWRLDIQRKYLRTYLGTSIDNSIEGAKETIFLPQMMNGRKKYQRRMFERNQELYMATKYFGTTATQDQIRIRFNNPETYVVEPDFTLYLTPFSNMYIAVKLGNVEPINFRAKAGVEYTIPYNIASDKADITLIYGASFIQAIGDLSKCYIGDNDFSKATRLQSLTIGSDIEGYANTYMTTLKLGNNQLLEYLDVRNVTGLTSPIDVSNCGNLIELRAEGSGATGVIFANGGKIKKFYIPDVVSLTAKNLNYIEDFVIEGYKNLQTLIVENTPSIDTQLIVSEAISYSPRVLQTLRLIGVDWSAKTTDIFNVIIGLRGVNNAGGEILQSVLAGSAYIDVVRQRELDAYEDAWPDLEVTCGSMIVQHPVTFVNDDENETVIEIQYVDDGGTATDLATRSDNRIIPTLPSTVSHDFSFDHWNLSLSDVRAPRTIKAVYTSSLRKYKIQYMSMGTVLPGYPLEGTYGDFMPYKDDTLPTYTAQEIAGKFYLFDRWDTSGYLDNGFDENGIKTVNAKFTEYQYVEGDFDNCELSELSKYPVKVYALTRLIAQKRLFLRTIANDMSISGDLSQEGIYRKLADGSTVDALNIQDEFSFVIGNDVEFDDIKQVPIVNNSVCVMEGVNNGKSTVFEGGDVIDTGIKLFDEDKDFVIAVDYTVSSNNLDGATIMQCYDEFNQNGIKFYCSNNNTFKGSVFMAQGTTSTIAGLDKREVLIIQHKKGDARYHIYKSNLDGENVTDTIVSASVEVGDDSTLVFGASKNALGEYINKARCTIHWAKLWYKDLGEDTCKSLAIWPHEKISMRISHFGKYYLSDGSGMQAPITLMASSLLGRTMKWDSSGTNTGGWANEELDIKNALNTRLFNAFPTQIKMITKQTRIYSSNGGKSSDVSYADCYVFIPALIEIDQTKTSSPFNLEGTPVSYMVNNSSRLRAFEDGTYGSYWTRSPNLTSSSYVYCVEYNSTSGTCSVQSIKGAANSLGVLIMISF